MGMGHKPGAERFGSVKSKTGGTMKRRKQKQFSWGWVVGGAVIAGIGTYVLSTFVLKVNKANGAAVPSVPIGQTVMKSA